MNWVPVILVCWVLACFIFVVWFCVLFGFVLCVFAVCLVYDDDGPMDYVQVLLLRPSTVMAWNPNLQLLLMQCHTVR